MKKFFKILSGAAAAFAVSIGIAGAAIGAGTPDHFRVTQGGSTVFDISGTTVRGTGVAETSGNAGQTTAQMMLFNAIPIKEVSVTEVNEVMLVPCGTPFGIKMMTNGVMVVGVADVQTEQGLVNPAAVAGIRTGDIITKVNGTEVCRNEQVGELIAKSGGTPVQIELLRDGKSQSVTLTAAQSVIDDTYKGGLWVRDSTAGIGTVTFYNPQDSSFAGLGHGICDVDTAELMPLKSGEIVPVVISGVQKGQKGNAGELRGYFDSSPSIGNVFANVEQGVYGTLAASPSTETAVPLGMKQEIHTGAAQILSTVDDEGPQYYDVQIESIHYNEEHKNLVLRVTDEALLGKTGGIVQGMSGSPILQDGKLIGAVTHVFIQDPQRGYGIFAEDMYEISQEVDQSSQQKAS